MTYVVEHADVGMIEAGDGFGFALKALFANGISGELRGENLDGDAAVQPRIFGAIHFAHAASAERGDDFIGTKLCTRSEWHRGAIITPESSPQAAPGPKVAASRTREQSPRRYGLPYPLPP